jgi:hypothetical protein
MQIPVAHNEEDKDKPLFLNNDEHFSAKNPDTWEKPEDMTYGDWFLQPHRPLSPRHKRIAELLVEGKRTGEIATELGYTQARISVLKTNSKIIAYMDRLRDRLFEKSVEERMSDLGPSALDNIEELLNNPDVPIEKKESISRWVVEMKTGKASQKVDVSGEISIGIFMDKLEQMSGKALGVTAPRQVEGTVENSEEHSELSVAPVDIYDEWLDKNT